MWTVEESRALAVAVDNLPYEEVPAAIDAIHLEGAKAAPSIEALPENVQAVMPEIVLTAAGGFNPTQARVPKGNQQGGRWIETAGGLMSRLSGGQAQIRVGESTYTGKAIPGHGREQQLRDLGGSTPTLYESDGSPESAQAFHDLMAKGKAANPYGASVHVYEPEEYADMRLFLTGDGTAGVALHGDEIVSVFKDPASPEKGMAQHLIASAIGQGGRRADAFDTVLPKLYAGAGLEVVSRLPWNDEYAPEGWDYEKFAPWNGGRPDVVFLRYNEGAIGSVYTPGSGEYVEDYDAGLASTQSLTASGPAHRNSGVNLAVRPDRAAKLGDLGVAQVSHLSATHELITFVLGHHADDSTFAGNPGQARVPRGNREGGRWLDTSGSIANSLDTVRGMTLPIDTDLHPALADLGWTVDPVTREVFPPQDGPPVEHADLTGKLGQPGPPKTYIDMAAHLQDVNPGAREPYGDVNCQRTSAAFEMAARGYDVVAPPAKGDDGQMMNVELMWETDSGKTRHASLMPSPNATAAIRTSADASPPGARYIVLGFNRERGFGHAWNAEVQPDGSIFEWDPQANDEMHSEHPNVGITDVRVMRVDDLYPKTTLTYNGGRDMPPWVLSQQDYIYFQNGNL